MNVGQIIIVIFIILGVVVAVISWTIDGMELIGAVLSLVLFLLVIPVVYYSRRKGAFPKSSFEARSV